MSLHITKPTFEVTLFEDYVIVSHNGKPFDNDDVEKITSYGFQSTDSDSNTGKNANSSKTGYKGWLDRICFSFSHHCRNWI